LRHQNCIICVIFKVRGPKYIFLKTFGTSSMFDAFLILVPILSILLLSKKSKSMAFNQDEIAQNKTSNIKIFFLK